MRSSLREVSRGFARCTSSWRSFSKMTDIQATGGAADLPRPKVTIYAPSKTPMQSGTAQTVEGGAPAWSMHVNVGPKWVNPLMGWTSTSNHDETVTRLLYFATKEAAAAFAEKNGMEYEIVEPAVVPKYRPKRFPGYGSNFDVARLKGGTPIGGLRSEQGTGGKK